MGQWAVGSGQWLTIMWKGRVGRALPAMLWAGLGRRRRPLIPYLEEQAIFTQEGYMNDNEYQGSGRTRHSLRPRLPPPSSGATAEEDTPCLYKWHSFLCLPPGRLFLIPIRRTRHGQAGQRKKAGSGEAQLSREATFSYAFWAFGHDLGQAVTFLCMILSGRLQSLSHSYLPFTGSSGRRPGGRQLPHLRQLGGHEHSPHSLPSGDRTVVKITFDLPRTLCPPQAEA